MSKSRHLSNCWLGGASRLLYSKIPGICYWHLLSLPSRATLQSFCISNNSRTVASSKSTPLPQAIFSFLPHSQICNIDFSYASALLHPGSTAIHLAINNLPTKGTPVRKGYFACMRPRKHATKTMWRTYISLKHHRNSTLPCSSTKYLRLILHSLPPNSYP